MRKTIETRRNRILRSCIEALEPRALLSGSWTPLTHAAPFGVGTMTLLPDGSVMATSSNVDWARLTPSASGSYVNGTWHYLASSHDSRLYDATQTLPDGRVFVAGGEYGTGAGTAETYDPLTNAWTTLPSQNFGAFIDSESVMLPSGNVLIAPVAPTNAGFTTIFHPSTNSWSQGPKLVRGSSADEQSFVRLADDSILTVDSNTTSERYIPSQNKWINDAVVPVPLFDSQSELGAGLLLGDGRALFLGGTGHTALYTPSGSTAPGTWAAGPDLPGAQGCSDAPAAMLPDGTVLIAAGPVGTLNGPTHFVIFNPTTNSFSSVTNTPSLDGSPFGARMLDLPDGTVLFTTGNSTPFIYNPNATALTAAKPAITSVAPNADGTVLLTGTGLNGLWAGAAYGDDAQMDSNYPIVRLTSSAGTIYYARTHDWSSTGVATGATPVTTLFTLPLGIPAGTYLLSVIANGVASDAVPFNVSMTLNNVAPTVATGAEVTDPTPITGISTGLTVLGADDAGESNLVYTWTTAGAPSTAPLPSFSVNGTNAAKDTVVTFHRVGTYTFVVFITDAGGLSTTASVTVAVTQTKSSITVTPAVATITTNSPQQFAAIALDQFGQKMSVQPAFTWSVPSGGGTITNSGYYVSPSAGTLASVQVTDGTFQASAKVGVVTAPWASKDIGGPGLDGMAYDISGTFTVQGSGGDIWGTGDQFRFVYQTLNGDGVITARVAAQTNTDQWAKSGVMIRNSLDASDKMAFLSVTPLNGVNLQYRAALKGEAASAAQVTGIKAPYWVRLVRTGNTITGYRSANGTNWTRVGSVDITMGATVFVGLEVCSHNNTLLNTATIDNATVVRGDLSPWLQYGTGAVYDAAAHTLTVTGNATIISDPGADAPNIVVQGGTLHINSSAHVSGITEFNGGAIVMTSVSSGGATRAAGAQHVLVINSGATLSIDGTSRLDLGSNDMMVRGGDVAALTALVQAGRNVAPGGNADGTWTGGGITSSDAASADAAAGIEINALAIALNSDLVLGSFSTFDGQPVTPGDVLIKYTYTGDLNLDGKVDDNDVTAMNLLYDGGLTTTQTWPHGDLNGDGKVDDTDSSILGLLFGNGAADSGLPTL